MSGSVKLGLTIVLTVVAIGIALKLLFFVWHLVNLLLPIAVLLAIGFVVYSIFGRKSLGGSNRRYLP